MEIKGHFPCTMYADVLGPLKGIRAGLCQQDQGKATKLLITLTALII